MVIWPVPEFLNNLSFPTNVGLLAVVVFLLDFFFADRRVVYYAWYEERAYVFFMRCPAAGGLLTQLWEWREGRRGREESCLLWITEWVHESAVFRLTCIKKNCTHRTSYVSTDTQLPHKDWPWEQSFFSLNDVNLVNDCAEMCTMLALIIRFFKMGSYNVTGEYKHISKILNARSKSFWITEFLRMSEKMFWISQTFQRF